MIKKSFIWLLVMVMMMQSFVFAEDTMTLEEAVESATSDTSSIDNINDVIEDLWDNYYAAKEGRKQIQETLDTFDDFETLYDKKYKDQETLTASETFELEMYQNIFGEKPPKFTKQEMLDQFIKPRDLPYKAVYAEIQKLKNTRVTIVPSMTAGVKGLFNQVLSLQETVRVQDNYLNIKQEEHASNLLKYQVGDLSEDDFEISRLNLLILDKQVEQLKINLKTLVMNFNKLVDKDLLYSFDLVDILTGVDVYNYPQDHHTLDHYLDLAVINRGEVKNARIDLELKKREESIIKNYLYNDLLTDRVEAEIGVLQMTYALEAAEFNVVDNVSDGYISMVTDYEDYTSALASLTIMKSSFEDMTQRLEVGYITQATVDLIEFQVMMQENTLRSHLRDYINAVDKMDKASSIGPAY